jgi:hypothetical protein
VAEGPSRIGIKGQRIEVSFDALEVPLAPRPFGVVIGHERPDRQLG